MRVMGKVSPSILDGKGRAGFTIYEAIQRRPEDNAQREYAEREWPKRGNIQFDNVSYSYDPNGEEILKDISFNINGGEKIGIIGRTGSGKSSLIEALFRMSKFSRGVISIDGVNLQSLGLDDSRNCLSVIPQNPTLFNGTIRYNLDPFDEKRNDQLWQALKDVHMSETISKIGGLNYEINEFGSNLSVGQKQLICLARAILKDSKILILDEATSNVDQQTDAIIQKTIKKSFARKTVIIIAHRLNTLAEVDKIMVLSDGKIKEFEKPETLLKNNYSLFYQLVKIEKSF